MRNKRGFFIPARIRMGGKCFGIRGFFEKSDFFFRDLEIEEIWDGLLQRQSGSKKTGKKQAKRCKWAKRGISNEYVAMWTGIKSDGGVIAGL